MASYSDNKSYYSIFRRAIYCTFKNSDKSEYQKTVSSLIENESYSNGHYFIANPKEHTVDEIIIFKEEY